MAVPEFAFDPNVRIRGNRAFVDWSDVIDRGAITVGLDIDIGSEVRLTEVETGATGLGTIHSYIDGCDGWAVDFDWSSLRLPTTNGG